MHRRGYTLLEIVIVLVILAVLAALGLVEFRAIHAKAFVTAMQTDLRNLETAEEAYFVDHQAYSIDATVLNFQATTGVTIALSASNLATGYTASATHDNLPREHCLMWVGTDAVFSPSGASVCSQYPNGSPPIGGAGVTPPHP